MFAVLHVVDFPLQAALRLARPLDDASPAALVNPDSRPSTLIACNAAARASGVVVGQTGPQALARCAALQIVSPHADAEAEARAALLAAASSVSPFVEDTAPGVVTIQIAGLPVERRRPALLSAIERLRPLSLQVTAGIGPTPLLALYAAREADPLLEIDDGRAFLGPLPLATADPPPELAAVLAGWGVKSLGDLTDLPKSAIAQRLGPSGLALWERAAGETSRPLRLIQTEPEFAATFECEHELETLEPVLFLLRRFVDRLALQLAGAALAAEELHLTLRLSDETVHARDLRLPEPSTQPDLLFRALQTHLETVRTASAVIGIQLSITPARAAVRQHGLFDNALRDPHRFAETLARISALVGPDRVGTPSAGDSHRPDTFTLTRPSAEITPPPPPAGFRHPLRGLPLRRFRPPLPATVELADGRHTPAYLWTRLVQGPIHAAAGPWRAAGDWWQPDQHWQREEWDVQLKGLYLLVRTPTGWFLEGEYD